MLLFPKRCAIGLFCCTLVLLQNLPLCCCSPRWCFGETIASVRSAPIAGQRACCCSRIQTCSRIRSSCCESAAEACETACGDTACGDTVDIQSHPSGPGKSCPCKGCFLKRAQVATFVPGGVPRFADDQAISLDFGHVIPSSLRSITCQRLALVPMYAVLSAQQRLAWICVWLK
jgi:hypothetical protein